MAGPEPRQVDAFIEERLLAPDPALVAALAANTAAGLPAIDVSPAQGKMLGLLARMSGAKRILEIGTLGGYSTIWLARALPPKGRIVTLEVDPHHAEIARANLTVAGVAECVEIRLGPAAASLAAMVKAGEGPFDLIFVDADKPSNVTYLNAALALSRPGSVLIFDNVVRDGAVLDPQGDANALGARALYDAVHAEPRLTATAIQTVGAKVGTVLCLRSSTEHRLLGPNQRQERAMTAIQQIPVTTIDGRQAQLADYAGKVLLVVNVASQCGLTPQYAGLVALHHGLKDRGFAVLGFPANDFGAQEPGTDGEIEQFCSTTYGVDFPMFSKIVVTGAEKHPLYAALTEAVPMAIGDGDSFRERLKGYGMTPTEAPEILWNFEKFVIGRDDRVAARFAPATTPDDPALRAAIEEQLAKPV